ncbi:MAG: transposase [Ferruginibacter sp.]
MVYKKHKQYRLPGSDYSASGDYFITICTKDRYHHFGKISLIKKAATITLTDIGSLVAESIAAIPAKFKHVTLGETVVMPNHIHLIISIPFSAGMATSKPSPLQQTIAPYKGLKPLTPGSVSSVINHFKGHVKKWCNANGYDYFKWQPRFHDHIIRSSSSYNRISNYIANNVFNWALDENNQDGKRFRRDIRT